MIVHLVTDRSRLAAEGEWTSQRRCVLEQAKRAVAAGIDVLQVRERDLEARALAALVSEIVTIARDGDTRVVVNDRVDVAIAAGAHGVHLRSNSLTPSAVRRIAPAGFLVGASVHSLDDARAARGADYLIAGTVWTSESKPGPRALLGLGGLSAIVRAAHVPVLAIGGVTLDRVGDVADAGAAGIAAIGLFVGPRDRREPACRAVSLGEAVKTLRQRFDTPRSRS